MMSSPRDQDELHVILARYKSLLWLVPKVGKFHRDLRFKLGERIERQRLLVLELLISTRDARAKRELLAAANVELDILRFLLRLSHELKALSNKDYGLTAGCVTDIGQRIGGWPKQESN